jgi:hypothetical protein
MAEPARGDLLVRAVPVELKDVSSVPYSPTLLAEPKEMRAFCESVLAMMLRVQ